jgi:hypothetical protein
VGGALGKPIILSLDQKAEAERQFERSIPNEVWKRLNEATNFYLVLGPKEKSAAPIELVLRRLAAIEKNVRLLRSELTEDPAVVTSELLEIERRFFCLPRTPAQRLDLNLLLLHCLDALLNLAEYGKKYYGSENEPAHQMFDEGTLWALWVVNVGRILAEAGLPTGVRKDRLLQERTEKKHSSFVYLINYLQSLIPIGLRRHAAAEHTADQTVYLDALSTAIQRARKKHDIGGILSDDLKSLWDSALLSASVDRDVSEQT